MAWYSGYKNPLQGFFWTWSNEKAHSGIDLPDNCGTPMTAILPGKVIIAGQYPCYGGQVSIQSTFAGQPIVYTYLHGSSHNVQVGQTVKPGQVVGYSGAPIASACGGGCHVHFEVEHGTQAPYTGGPPQNSSGQNYPINPVPLLAYAATGKIGAGAGGSPPGGTSGNSTTVASQVQCPTPTNTFDIAGWAAYAACVAQNGLQATEGPFAQIGLIWATIGPWIGIRGLKLVAGVLMVGIGLLALILPSAAPILAGTAAVATGNPELALPAANAASSIFKKQGTPNPPPPSRSQGVAGLVSARAQQQQRRRVQEQQPSQIAAPQAAQAPQAQAVPQIAGPQQPRVQVAQSYTTRNLGIEYSPAVVSSPLHSVFIGYKPNPNPPAPQPARVPVATGGSMGMTGTQQNPMTPEEIAALHPIPVSRAPKGSTLQVPRAAPQTQPLSNAQYGATTTVTGTPIPDARHVQTIQRIQATKAQRAPGVQTAAPLPKKQRIPQSRRKQSQMSIEELRAIPTSQLTEASKRRVKAETRQGLEFKRQRQAQLGGIDIDQALEDFRKATGQE